MEFPNLHYVQIPLGANETYTSNGARLYAGQTCLSALLIWHYSSTSSAAITYDIFLVQQNHLVQIARAGDTQGRLTGCGAGGDNAFFITTGNYGGRLNVIWMAVFEYN